MTWFAEILTAFGVGGRWGSWAFSMRFSASWLLSFNVISTKGSKKILTQMRKMQLKYKYHMHHETNWASPLLFQMSLGLYWDILAPRYPFTDTLACIPRSEGQQPSSWWQHSLAQHGYICASLLLPRVAFWAAFLNYKLEPTPNTQLSKCTRSRTMREALLGLIEIRTEMGSYISLPF